MSNPCFSSSLQKSSPLDYLVIGHITADLTPSGVLLGGTATFSSLTAHALGLTSGILTAFGKDLNITPVKHLWIKNLQSETTTTFKNISDGIHRTQYLYHPAKSIHPIDIPKTLSSTPIVHLGPVADEVNPDILACFPNSLKCLTPQGWFRGVNEKGQVIYKKWEEFRDILPQADIAVISQEDVHGDEDCIAAMAASIPIFVVTENFKGARVYWNNDARYFKAPAVKYVNDTGAGDIFSAAFFYRYFITQNPWEAGRFAVLLASWSVSRKYLNSIPTPEDIRKAQSEVINS